MTNDQNIGWIKLDRGIMNNRFYFAEKFTKAQAWIDLILMAAHKPNSFYVRGNRVKVGRGEIGISRNTIAQRWQWSIPKVDRFIKDLIDNEEIERLNSNSKLTTIIRLKNYDKFQFLNGNVTTEFGKTLQQNEVETLQQKSVQTLQQKNDCKPLNSGNSENNNLETLQQNESETLQQKSVQTLQQNSEKRYINKEHSPLGSVQRAHAHTREGAELFDFVRSLSSISEMSQPLLPDQADSIIKKHNLTDSKSVFLAMENEVGLAKRNKSCFLTFVQWMGVRQKRNPSFGQAATTTASNQSTDDQLYNHVMSKISQSPEKS